MLGKLVKAEVSFLNAYLSADSFQKIEGLKGYSPGLSSFFNIEMECLVFDEKHLFQDGFFAFQLLERLRAVTGKFWFIFGYFESIEGMRVHLVLPADKVPEKFIIYKWRVERWIQETITI